MGPAVFEHAVGRNEVGSVERVWAELALVPAAMLPSGAPTQPVAQDVADTPWHALVGRRIAMVRERLMFAAVQMDVLLMATLTVALDFPRWVPLALVLLKPLFRQGLY